MAVERHQQVHIPRAVAGQSPTVRYGMQAQPVNEERGLEEEQSLPEWVLYALFDPLRATEGEEYCGDARAGVALIRAVRQTLVRIPGIAFGDPRLSER